MPPAKQREQEHQGMRTERMKQELDDTEEGTDPDEVITKKGKGGTSEKKGKESKSREKEDPAKAPQQEEV